MNALSYLKRNNATSKTLKVLVLIVAFFACCLVSNATVRTWTNATASTYWGTAGNWSGGVAPGAADTAQFTSSYNGNCNLNAATTVGAIIIQAGYTGTIWQNSYKLTVTNIYSQASGKFVGSDRNIIDNGTFKLTGGTFTSTSGQLQVDDDFMVGAGATFSHNYGAIIFNKVGATTVDIPNNSMQVYDLTFNSGVGTTISSSDTLIVLGSLRFQQNEIKGGVIRMAVGSDITINAAFTGGTTILDVRAAVAITPRSAFCGVVLNNASASISAPTADCSFGGPVKIVAGTFNCGTNNITMLDNFEQVGGTFTASTGLLSFEKNFIRTAGTFNPSTGTVQFTSANDAVLAFNNRSTTFYKVNLAKTSSSNTVTLSANDTLIVSNALTLTKGMFNSGYIKPMSTMTVGAAFGGGSAQTLITTANTYTIPANDTMTAITINNASAIVNLGAGASVIFEGNINLMSGTFNSTSNKLRLNTNLNVTGGTFNCTTDTMFVNTNVFNIQAGTFNHNNGTVYFNSPTQGVTIADPTKITFYKLLVNLSNATATNAQFAVATGNTIAVSNSLVLVAGNLYSGTVEVRGAFIDNINFGGGVGTLSFIGGTGTRVLTLKNANPPAITINDALVDINAPTDRAITFSQPFNLLAGEYFPDNYATTFSNTYTQTGGTFWDGSKKETFTSNVSVTGGTFYGTSDTLQFDAASVTFGTSSVFNHNNGTLSFAGAGNTAFSTPVTFTAYNLYINLTNATNNILSLDAGDTIAVNNSLALVKGRVNTGFVKLKGTIANATTFSGGSATIYVAGGTLTRTITLPATTLPYLMINDLLTTVNAPATGTLSIQGDMTLTKGTFTIGSSTVSVAGNYTQTGGTFNGGSGKLVIGGNFSESVLLTAFTAPSDSLVIGGTFTVTSPATFTHNGGTLHFTGATTRVLSYNGGTLALKNLSIGYTGNAELRPNCALNITGNLTIGAAARLNQSTSSVDMSIGGNFTDLNTTQGLIYGTRTVTFNGAASQRLEAASGTEYFYGLTVSNTLGGLHPANTNLYVYNLLTLTSLSLTKIYLGNNNLTINSAGTISGGSATEYVVTDGTGALRQENIGVSGRNGTIVFPVGPSAFKYTPVSLRNIGTNDRFDVRIASGAWSAGTTGSAVVRGTVTQTYHVEEAVAGGSNVTLTLQWNLLDEFTGLIRSNCGIRHYTGGQWRKEGTDGVSIGTGPFTKTASGITTFSPFGVGSDGAGGSLPIELSGFTAVVNDNNHVDLQWNTAIEVNNHFFTIERSTDGKTYTDINITQGSGNSTIEQQYSFTDENPMTGTNYYRLKQTDYDGEFAHVGEVAVKVAIAKADNNITLYPNPVEGREVKLVVGNGQTLNTNATVSITDMAGRNIYSSILSSANTTLSLPQHIVQGMYLVQVCSGTQVHQQKLLVR